ncbi:hypothetical protein EC594_04400 [Helicobacter pylori]|nr:hypothetical protein EC594_04400 [Helicobacter pylori]
MPISGLVFKIRIFKLFLLRYFWLCDTKTFIFKNGLFVFVILKLILKNISNSASSFIIDCKNAFSIF